MMSSVEILLLLRTLKLSELIVGSQKKPIDEFHELSQGLCKEFSFMARMQKRVLAEGRKKK